MMKLLDKKQLTTLIIAAAYMVIGALLCIYKGAVLGAVLEVVLIVLGALFFVYGIANLFHKKVKEGLICMVIGIAVVLFAWLLTEIIMASFGVLIIIKGILDLAAALKTKKVFSIIFSIVSIIIGLLFIAGYFLGYFFGEEWEYFDIFFIVIGSVFIFNGVLVVISSFTKSKKSKNSEAK